MQCRNRDADIENGCVGMGQGKREGEMNWEIGFDIYILPCVKHIASENLLYSAAPQCSVTYRVRLGGGVRSQTEGIYVPT